MRRAITMGLAGVMLAYAAGAQQRTAAPSDNRPSAAVHRCVDTDPESLQCDIPDHADLELVRPRHELIQPIVHEHANRLVNEVLRTHGLHVYDTPFSSSSVPLPATLRISYLRRDQVQAAYDRVKHEDDTRPLRGFADLKGRTAHLVIDEHIAGAQETCPAESTLLLAATTLHEIGHLLGLIHIGEIKGSIIPANFPDGRWNIMLQGVPVSVRDCDPRTLTIDDLPSDFDEMQARMMRSAADAGTVWSRIQRAGHDFHKYWTAYGKGVESRTAASATSMDAMP